MKQLSIPWKDLLKRNENIKKLFQKFFSKTLRSKIPQKTKTKKVLWITQISDILSRHLWTIKIATLQESCECVIIYRLGRTKTVVRNFFSSPLSLASAGFLLTKTAEKKGNNAHHQSKFHTQARKGQQFPY